MKIKHFTESLLEDYSNKKLTESYASKAAPDEISRKTAEDAFNAELKNGPAVKKQYNGRWYYANEGTFDLPDFHIAYDKYFEDNGILDIFNDAGLLKNSGVYGQIKNLDSTNSATKAIKKLWAAQFKQELNITTDMVAKQAEEAKKKAEEEKARLEQEKRDKEEKERIRKLEEKAEKIWEDAFEEIKSMSVYNKFCKVYGSEPIIKHKILWYPNQHYIKVSIENMILSRESNNYSDNECTIDGSDLGKFDTEDELIYEAIEEIKADISIKLKQGIINKQKSDIQKENYDIASKQEAFKKIEEEDMFNRYGLSYEKLIWLDNGQLYKVKQTWYYIKNKDMSENDITGLELCSYLPETDSIEPVDNGCAKLNESARVIALREKSAHSGNCYISRSDIIYFNKKDFDILKNAGFKMKERRNSGGSQVDDARFEEIKANANMLHAVYNCFDTRFYDQYELDSGD